MYDQKGKTNLPILLTPILESFSPATSFMSRLEPVLIAQPDMQVNE